MSRLYLALSAFTASANVPAIYLQQFWKTMSYNEKTRVYSCQVDEQWFDLSVDLLRKALAITPVNPLTKPNELTSVCSANSVGETSLKTNVDHAEQIWKSINSREPDIFLSQQIQTQSQSEEPKEESNSSPHPLWMVFQGNLKFVPKGESVEVFGMAIPDPLITEAIQQSSYYPKYLKMVAENTKKTPKESASVQPATKRATTAKSPTTYHLHESNKPSQLLHRQRVLPET
ncbi:hypothetical protein Tco_0757643 [Tanacetum coccineum]